MLTFPKLNIRKILNKKIYCIIFLETSGPVHLGKIGDPGHICQWPGNLGDSTHPAGSASGAQPCCLRGVRLLTGVTERVTLCNKLRG